MGNQTVDGPC